MTLAVFDLETNGGPGASVLSCSSIVFDEDGRILDIFNRFYLPAERFDAFTARIHGLTPGRLGALRTGARHYDYFLEDWVNLVYFWKERDVEGIVAHNLSFDASFLPEIAQGDFLWWCSMRGLTRRCAIPKRPGNAKIGSASFKWPKLGEAVDILCNGPYALLPPSETERIETALNGDFPHVSLFDCFELYRVISRLTLHAGHQLRFAPSSVPFRKTARRAAPEPEPYPMPDRFTDQVKLYERSMRSFISASR
jgi:DNA polymerase III epsilon subunit-like protein